MWISLVVQHSRIHLPIQGSQVQSLVRERRSHMPWVYTTTREKLTHAMKTQHNQKKRKNGKPQYSRTPTPDSPVSPFPRTAPGLVFHFPQALTGRTEELYHFNSHNTIIMYVFVRSLFRGLESTKRIKVSLGGRGRKLI